MAVTLAAPNIGTAHVDGHSIRVQRRPGATAVWMTIQSTRRSQDIALGVLGDLNTVPSFQIFQAPAAAGWDTPQAHQRLLDAVLPLYRADEARHAA